MLNKMTTTAGFVMLCSGAWAQTTTPGQTIPPAPTTTPGQSSMSTSPAKPSTVVVTGCVAAGAGEGQFMLNNAMMAHDASKPTGAAGTTGTTQTPSTSSPPSSQTTPSQTPAPGDTSKMTGHSMATSSYTLVGGENLKAHVGHKVEITGALDAGMGQTSSSAGTPSSGTRLRERRLRRRPLR